jgi:hypothetical protein
MRGTLAQEAQQAMQDARDANKAVVEQQPSDQEKLIAYQTATNGVMAAAVEGKAETDFAYPNFAILRYVGEQLIAQGIGVKFDFSKCSLTAKWG